MLLLVGIIVWQKSNDVLEFCQEWSVFASGRSDRKHQDMATHTIAVIAYDAVNLFQLGVATEIFGVERPELPVSWYRFRLCATEPGLVRSSTGLLLSVPYSLEDLAEADTIIVPSSPRYRTTTAPGDLLDALRVAYKRRARVISFCTGAFLLAQAGLLDGRQATTHWAWATELAERYPTIQVDPHVLYVADHPIFTAAGTAAAIDLSLYIVRQDYGAEIATSIARRMVVPLHREGGQAQYIETPLPEPDESDPFGATLAWIATHLDSEVSMEQLASRAAMSRRTFARRFSATLGTTPYRWILQQRIVQAQRLLETTSTPIEQIATCCGFTSAATLRLHFQQLLHVSPQNYRQAFQQERGKRHA
jgi:AraC family transcriptional regulator, transcriptional activator FtrA